MKNKKLNVTIKVLETVEFKYSGYSGSRLDSWRGSLFCLISSCRWVFWVNNCLAFSCISYFVLESRQMKYLDTSD